VDRVVRNLELMDWLLYIKESEFKREGFKLITNNTVAVTLLCLLEKVDYVSMVNS
jgi:hypothetical protein